MPATSFPALAVTDSRSLVRSDRLSATARSNRSTSAGIRSGSTRRLGISKSSASSTTAVLITTPGETPMPFLISILVASRERQVTVDRHGLSQLAAPNHLVLFFAELAREQLGQLIHRGLGVVALGLHPQHRAHRRLQRDHLHHALPVHPTWLAPPPSYPP